MKGRNGYAAKKTPTMASRIHPRFFDQNVTGWSPVGLPRPTRFSRLSVIPMAETSDLFSRLLAQQPGGAPEENSDEDDEYEDIFPGAAHVTRKHGFHESQQQPTDHGPRDIADTTHNGGRKRLEAIAPAHVETDGAVVHAVHDTGDPAEGRAQREDEEDDDANVDAHQRRSAAIKSGGPYSCTECRLLDNEPDDQHECKREQQDDNLQAGYRYPQEGEARRRDDSGRIRLGPRAPDGHDAVLQEDGHAERGDDQRKPACGIHGTVCDAFHQDAGEADTPEGKQHRYGHPSPEPEVNRHPGRTSYQQRVAQIRTQSEEVTMGEVDQFHNTVHHRIAQCHQCVERTDGQAIYQLFKERGHGDLASIRI